jgi:hypothetical protein
VQNGNEIDPALVDHREFYLLNYFKPAHDQQNSTTNHGRSVFTKAGCSSCHIADMTINHDRRVADLEAGYDPVNGVFNSLFATASALYYAEDDGSGQPPLKLPLGNSFVVKDIFTVERRHFAPRGRSSGSAERVRRSEAKRPEEPAHVPELAFAVSTRRHGIDIGSGGPQQIELPAIRAREHQADGTVQRSDGSGVARAKRKSASRNERGVNLHRKDVSRVGMRISATVFQVPEPQSLRRRSSARTQVGT